MTQHAHILDAEHALNTVGLRNEENTPSVKPPPNPPIADPKVSPIRLVAPPTLSAAPGSRRAHPARPAAPAPAATPATLPFRMVPSSRLKKLPMPRFFLAIVDAIGLCVRVSYPNTFLPTARINRWIFLRGDRRTVNTHVCWHVYPFGSQGSTRTAHVRHRSRRAILGLLQTTHALCHRHQRAPVSRWVHVWERNAVGHTSRW